MPRLQKRLTIALPGASRSLKGWVKFAPAEQRLPIPLVLLCCIMAWFLRRQQLAHALCLYIQFLTYLRPGESVNIVRSQLIEPTPTAGHAYHGWGLNIAPTELGRPGKTGTHDVSIMIRCAPWLSPWIRTLKWHGNSEQKVWPFNLTELARLFAEAVTACRFESLRPTLYAIRHGGGIGRPTSGTQYQRSFPAGEMEELVLPRAGRGASARCRFGEHSAQGPAAARVGGRCAAEGRELRCWFQVFSQCRPRG